MTDYEEKMAAWNFLDIASHLLLRNWTEENFSLWQKAREEFDRVVWKQHPECAPQSSE